MLLRREQIDDHKWDACIRSSGLDLPYGLSGWLDTVCDQWEGIVIDDYTSVFPLPITVKMGVKLVVQPPFTQQLGWFGQPVDLPVEVGGPGYIDLNLNWKTKAANGLVQRTNLVLNLNQDYPNLKSGYNSNTKRNLKKFQAAGLNVETSADPASVIQLFAANKGQELMLSSKYLDALERLVEVGVDGVGFEAFSVLYNGKLAAGLVTFRFNQRIILGCLATSEVGRAYQMMTGIIDHVISNSAQQDLVLDFEGAQDDGVARFYKGFGAQRQDYWNWNWSKPGVGSLLQAAKSVKGKIRGWKHFLK